MWEYILSIAQNIISTTFVDIHILLNPHSTLNFWQLFSTGGKFSHNFILTVCWCFSPLLIKTDKKRPEASLWIQGGLLWLKHFRWDMSVLYSVYYCCVKPAQFFVTTAMVLLWKPVNHSIVLMYIITNCSLYLHWAVGDPLYVYNGNGKNMLANN